MREMQLQFSLLAMFSTEICKKSEDCIIMLTELANEIYLDKNLPSLLLVLQNINFYVEGDRHDDLILRPSDVQIRLVLFLSL